MPSCFDAAHNRFPFARRHFRVSFPVEARSQRYDPRGCSMAKLEFLADNACGVALVLAPAFLMYQLVGYVLS
jgi:hypothetical protein